MSVSLITRKVYLAIIGTVVALSASITFASSPSSEFLYIGAPSFYAEMDVAGYSDWIYWGPSERHNAFQYHESLSGEWGSAVYFDGLDTEFIDPNNQSLGRKAMWLTDEFLFPYWSTGSSFEIFFSDDSWDNQENPVPADNEAYDRGDTLESANDTAHTIIRNEDQRIEVSIKYEVVDLGSSVDEGVGGSPLAFLIPDPNNPDEIEHYFVESDRYLFLQTYTFRNTDPNEETLTNLEFYQMLHSHANDNYGDVSIAYDDSDFWPDSLENYIPYDPNHKSGNFCFDITSWSASGSYPSHNDPDEVDWVGFSCTVEPNWVECGFYRGGHSYDPDNKPSRPGTHWNIEDRNLSGDIYQYDEVAGAMGWSLGSLAPNESTSITVAFMFGTGPIKTMANVHPPIHVEIKDDASGCVSPCPSEKTFTIDYSYLWNIPGWESLTFSPSDVKELELTCYLPPEADFVSADPNDGYYDSDLHAYVWYIGDLTGGENESLDISVSINSTVIPGSDILSQVVADYTVSGIEYSQQTEHPTPVCECDCGTIIYVDQDATSGGDDGTSWADAYLKLQDALAQAGMCDEIWVAEGTYTPADDPNDYATFDFVNGVRAYGGFDGTETDVYERDWLNNETILSGYIDPNNVNYVVTTDPTVRWAIIEGFTIKNGLLAGILCEGGSVHIEHNKITDNRTGILCDGTQLPIIRNNWIYANSTGMSFVDLQDIAIVRNNTVVDNDPTGVYCDSDIEPSIKNCIFRGHADANDLIGCYATYSCIEYPTDFYEDPNETIYLGIGQGNIDDNPLFETGDYHLSSTSPCIDAGDPNETYYHQRDIDKQFRVLYGRVDMGADEYYDCSYVSDADFNSDGIVNFPDYGQFAQHWLETAGDPNWDSLYDLAGDNEAIDAADLTLFAGEWLWMDCDTMTSFPMPEQSGIDETYEMMMMSSGSSTYGLQAAQAEPALKEQIDNAQEIIDFFENLWKKDKELRKTIDKKKWDVFIDKLYEWLYSLEELYAEEPQGPV